MNRAFGLIVGKTTDTAALRRQQVAPRESRRPAEYACAIERTDGSPYWRFTDAAIAVLAVAALALLAAGLLG